MRWTAEIVVVQEVDPRIVPEMSPGLSVSLDCIGCRRHSRTIGFHRDHKGARCYPGWSTRHLGPHPFPGELLGIQVDRRANGFEAVYRIAYDTHSYLDARHGAKLPYRGYPTWAAVAWAAICPECGAHCELSTQSSRIRPPDRRCRRCALVMQREHGKLPMLRYLDPDAGGWREVPTPFSGTGS